MSATTQMGNDVPYLLRAAYPRHTVKRAAIAADVPTETAKKWVAGRATPSASILLRMAARCEQLADTLERILHDRRAAALSRQLPAQNGRGAAQQGGAQ